MRVAGIYLGNPMVDRLDPDPEEPIGLEYVLATLQQDGHNVCLLSPWYPGPSIFERLEVFRPDVVLLQIYSRDVPEGIRLARQLKTLAPHVPIVAGGYHPTALPEQLLREAEGTIDYCVVGEGEATASELLRSLEQGRTGNGIAGLTFLDSKQQAHMTQRRPLIENLDSLPWPIREPRYYDLPTGGFYYPEASRLRYAPIIYSRGCYGRCHFCCSPAMWERVVRFRDPHEVVEEMNRVHESYGVNFFFVEDLSINVDDSAAGARGKSRNAHLRSLCEAMIAGLKEDIYWGCCANIGLSDEHMRLMKEAHCVTVSFGIESLHDHTLETVAKHQNREEIEDTLRRSASLGLINYGFSMIGFEGDTEESILRTASDLASLPLHRLRVACATPFPGTKWHKRLEKVGARLSQNWCEFDTQHPVILSHSIRPTHMNDLKDRMIEVFYRSPSYLRNVQDLLAKSPKLTNSFQEFWGWLNRCCLSGSAVQKQRVGNRCQLAREEIYS